MSEEGLHVHILHFHLDQVGGLRYGVIIVDPWLGTAGAWEGVEALNVPAGAGYSSRQTPLSVSQCFSVPWPSTSLSQGFYISRGNSSLTIIL